jgi:hypothetical protein
MIKTNVGLYCLSVLLFAVCIMSTNKVSAQQLAFNDTPPATRTPPVTPASHSQKQPAIGMIEPIFPGGSDSLENYLFMHIQTPDSLWKRDISGSIYFSFYVENDGKIDRIKIEKTIPSPGWDSAVINCIRTMPNWVPGSVNASPKAMRCFLPVSIPPGHQLYNMPDSVNIR